MSFNLLRYLIYTFHYAWEYLKNYKILMSDLLQGVIFWQIMILHEGLVDFKQTVWNK